MIDDSLILNRIAKVLSEKFDWAATIQDKFEVWFQIEILLAFFGNWPEAGFRQSTFRSQAQFHPVNGNLVREHPVQVVANERVENRIVDFLIAADGKPIYDKSFPELWSSSVYAIELKYGLPRDSEDAIKDIQNALAPAQVPERRGLFGRDRGMAVFILSAQDNTIQGLRSFAGQIDRIVHFARRFERWTLLRNSEYSSPNYMVVAVVPLGTAGLQLIHYEGGNDSRHPRFNEYMSYSSPSIRFVNF